MLQGVTKTELKLQPWNAEDSHRYKENPQIRARPYQLKTKKNEDTELKLSKSMPDYYQNKSSRMPNSKITHSVEFRNARFHTHRPGENLGLMSRNKIPLNVVYMPEKPKKANCDDILEKCTLLTALTKKLKSNNIDKMKKNPPSIENKVLKYRKKHKDFTLNFYHIPKLRISINERYQKPELNNRTETAKPIRKVVFSRTNTESVEANYQKLCESSDSNLQAQS